MIKTQVQIPDHLHREAKRIAEQYEMSFAEVVRRGLERMVPCYPPRAPAAGAWRLPRLDLGLERDPFADPEWRSELHSGASAVAEPEPPSESRKPPRGGRR
ncbi:MAG: hypothetical protein H6Q03_2581 [Acidobacteria bacterium]|jgi:hypothetical protein|nr:hypothetical protein [Acidobacteriota bacterium]